MKKYWGILLGILIIFISGCMNKEIKIPSNVLFENNIKETPFRSEEGIKQEYVYYKNEKNETLEGFLLTCEDSEANVVFFPGNMGISEVYKGIYLDLIKKKKVNMFIPNYPGYGFSDGSPTVDRIKENNIVSAREFLRKVDNSKPFYIMGYSLGTFAALDLYRKIENRGIVLLAPFSNMDDVAKEYKKSKVPFFARPFVELKGDEVLNGMNNEKLISSVENSVIISGEKDEMFPYYLGEKLHEKQVTGKKHFAKISGADHNGILQDKNRKELITNLLKIFE